MLKRRLHPLATRTFLKLSSDYGFKWLFASPERNEILRKFLNALFASHTVVTKVVFHDKEVLPPDASGKRILYDAYCTTDTGHHFIVEMQQEFTPNFGKRMVFYLSSGIYRQGERGKSYNFEPVYTIVITDFNMKPLKKQLVNEVVLMEKNTHVVFTEDVKMYYLSLKCVNRDWDKCESELERQLYLIKNMEKLDKQSKPYLSGDYDEIFRASEIASMAQEDVIAYSESMYKEMEMVEALEYNREVAMKKGEAKGRAEGKAEIARAMKKNGMPWSEIMLYTGLTAEQIENLI